MIIILSSYSHNQRPKQQRQRRQQQSPFAVVRVLLFLFLILEFITCGCCGFSFVFPIDTITASRKKTKFHWISKQKHPQRSIVSLVRNHPHPPPPHHHHHSNNIIYDSNDNIAMHSSFSILKIQNKIKTLAKPKATTIPTPTTFLLPNKNKKQLGSEKYKKSWRHWSRWTVNAIRTELATKYLLPPLPSPTTTSSNSNNNTFLHSYDCHPVDQQEFQNLTFQLGVAADYGRMPSFSNPGARSGYALEFFCRVRLLADLFFVLGITNSALDNNNNNNNNNDDSLPLPLPLPLPLLPRELYMGNNNINNNNKFTGTDRSCNITSLGGGPGFDFVAASLVATFFHSGGEEKEFKQKVPTTLITTKPKLIIRTTVLDYESGWENLVYAMGNATQSILQQSPLSKQQQPPNDDNNDITNTNNNNISFSCSWGGQCDITKSLYDSINVACLQQISTTNVWTCQYCIAENAIQLKDSNFLFFRQLFDIAPDDSIFIFTETTPRLWPQFYNLFFMTSSTTQQQQHDCSTSSNNNNNNNKNYIMQMEFINMRGEQMILRKKSIRNQMQQQQHTEPITPKILISEKDLMLLSKFEDYAKQHEQSIGSGKIRQAPKVTTTTTTTTSTSTTSSTSTREKMETIPFL